MRIIYPDHLYDKALQLANCKRLTERRNEICTRTLKKIVEEEGGPLTDHVTLTRALTHRHFIRNFNNLSLYICRTERFKNSFFPSTIVKFNRSISNQ